MIFQKNSQDLALLEAHQPADEDAESSFFFRYSSWRFWWF